jgi:hypothetical protein
VPAVTEKSRPARADKLAAAVEVALEIQAFLLERLGSKALLLDSGRGRQLWFRTPHGLTKDERKRFLAGLAARFDRRGLVEVDRAVFNASRLVRLPGGQNWKTDREARILAEGDGQTPGLEEFRAFIEELAPAPAPTEATRRGVGQFATNTGEVSPWTQAICEAVSIDQTLGILGLESTGEDGRRSCPIHGGTNPTSFREWQEGAWYCHSNPDCGGGDVIKLVEQVRGIGRLEARDWLAERLGVSRQEPLGGQSLGDRSEAEGPEQIPTEFPRRIAETPKAQRPGGSATPEGSLSGPPASIAEEGRRMDSERAVELLRGLADGVHPFTGEDLPASSPCQDVDVVRALFAAIEALR